jgi:hypothetical protein
MLLTSRSSYPKLLEQHAIGLVDPREGAGVRRFLEVAAEAVHV